MISTQSTLLSLKCSTKSLSVSPHSQGINYSENVVVSTFDALDEQGLIESRPWLGFDAAAIATSDFGDSIYLRPGATESDAVYITHHDGGGTEVLAPDVFTFVERLRHANCND